MKAWLKRVCPQRHALEARWFLKPFAAILMDPACWTFHRNNVSRAFALGLFIAFIPPTPLLPVHFILCAILGVSLRVNLPVVFATVFVSNPITWLPQIWASIWVGAKLTGTDLTPVMHHLGSRHLWMEVNQLWVPLLLGALVLGLVAAGVGYVLAQGVWRAHVLFHLRRRRARIFTRGAALNENSVRQDQHAIKP